MIWLDQKLVLKSSTSRTDRKYWSAIIPAAGSGTRLGHSKPKILFPLLGKTVLEWMVESLLPEVEELVFVVSPKGQPEIRHEVLRQGLAVDRVRFVVQPEPRGMAEAVWLGLDGIRTNHTFVIWGDQPFLRKSLLRAMAGAQVSRDLSGVLPLLERENPYVHYAVDERGKLAEVLQKRENDPLPKSGLSDVGCFSFECGSLREILAQSTRGAGNSTREWNLLPEIPSFEDRRGGLGAIRLRPDAPEGISINTPDEAASAEEWARVNEDQLRDGRL